jgi:uncharacterized membrane protein (UPF0127 family)
MKKDLAVIFGLFLLIAILIVFGRGYTSSTFLSNGATSEARREGFVPIEIKGLSVNAKVVSKASDRKKGLSKQDSLPLNQGMLFVFDSSGLYPFWMKDMKFSIDIIWIDEEKRIVSIAHNAVPEPGVDDEDLILYRPSAEAKYVLEINAGLSRVNGLEQGDIVNFEL